MLDLFRQQSGSWVIWSLLSIIILAFIFTFNTSGGPIAGRPGADVSGTLVEVYGEPIDTADVELAMQLSADAPNPGASGIDKLQAQNRYEGSRMLFSGVPSDLIPLTPFDGETPPIKREKVMTELIETVLVGRDAAMRGLGVSDGELTERVLRLQKIFGTSWTDEQGNFEPRKYDIFVRYQLGTTKAHFEQFLRREILRDKMAHVVTAGVRANDKELQAVEYAEKKRPRLEFVAIDANAAKETIKVTDEEAAAWAKDNGDKIKAAYEAAGEEYNKPAKWGVRGILLKAPNREGLDDAAAKDADKKWAEQKTAADALRKELDDAFAGKTAIDPPPASSGDDEAAKPAGEAKKITDVKEEERKAWLDAHFAKIAKDKTEHDLTKDVGGKFIDEKSVDALGLAPFGPDVATAVQAAKLGDVVGPVKGSHGWWILRVEEKIEAKVIPLADAQIKLARGLVAEERATKELDKVGQSVLDAAKAAGKAKLADVVKAWNKSNAGKEDGPLVASTSGQIGKAPTRAMTGSLEALLGLPPRNEDPNDIPGMGNLPEVVKAAWKLSDEQPLADQVFKAADGKTRYVVRLAKEEKPPAETEEDKKKQAEQEKTERDTLRDTVTGMRKRAVWQAYVKQLMADAEAAEEIDRTDAWTQLVDAERKRYAEAVKRAAATKPAAPAGNPFNVQVSPPTFSEPMPEPGKAPEAPAKPADAPAAPAGAPAEAPAKPAEAPAAPAAAK